MCYRTQAAARWAMAACVGVLVAARAAGPALRVVGGRDAVVGEFPYVVKTEAHLTGKLKINATYSSKESFKLVGCSGAVLTATWVLTAAHCFREINNFNETTYTIPKEISGFVRYGFALGKESNSDGLSKILMAIFPPQARESRGDVANDIALLNTEPILIDRYAKISAIDYTSLYGHEVTLAGFGLMVLNSSNFGLPKMFHKPLQVMKGMLKSCKDVFPTMCAVAACGQSQMVAPVDSGSAVLHPSGVVAVVVRGKSFYRFLEIMHPPSYKTSQHEYMSLTPVSPYLDWIVNIIKRESPSKKLTKKEIKEDSRRQRLRDNEMVWSGTDIL